MAADDSNQRKDPAQCLERAARMHYCQHAHAFLLPLQQLDNQRWRLRGGEGKLAAAEGVALHGGRKHNNCNGTGY
jgi:hypothetical protein